VVPLPFEYGCRINLKSMFLIIYLIGVFVAIYLIGKKMPEKADDIEFTGDIVAYLFALFSWVTVLALLLILLFNRKR
jgi:hypothetical protein